jgi:Smg protein
MKENVFDVLLYLFENYMDADSEQMPDPDSIRTELIAAGFPHRDIDKAFQWLESLTQGQPIQTTMPTFRIYAPEEMAKLDHECRGLLLFLEQSGILNPSNRELVIDRAMALSTEELSLENLKWIVLMVLFSQPDQELAFARMEDLVYDNAPLALH